MAYCGNCGTQIPDGSRFCGNCGAQQGGGVFGGLAGNKVQKNGVTFTKADVIDFEIIGDDRRVLFQHPDSLFNDRKIADAAHDDRRFL